MHVGCLTRITLGHSVKGGMEVHVDTLARGLVGRGHRVTIVTTGRADGVEEETDGGVKTFYLAGTRPGKYSDAWGHEAARFMERLHAQDPMDAIWGEGAGAYYYLKWYRNPLRLPVVTFLQGTYLGELGTFWHRSRLLRDWRPFSRFVLWRTIQYFRWDLWYTHGANMVVGASRENAALARWGYLLPKRKILASVNGVDVERFCPDPIAGRRARRMYGVPEDAPLLLHCSRLEPEKGASITLRATANLRQRHPSLRLWVAGDGLERDRLPALAAQLGIERSVSFLGHVPNEETPALYNASTVFVNPTLAVEAFGITAAEAMACARPVVASRLGGIRTSVEHERTGLLVRPGDVSGLVDAVDGLLGNPDERRRLGEAGREKALRDLSATRMVDDVLRALEIAMTGARRGGFD